MDNSEKTKLYKIRNGWMMGNEMDYDENRRPIAKLIIGDVTINKKIESYIVEDVYKDILDDVMSDVSSYDVTEKLGAIPQVVIESNGSLVMHNPQISGYLVEVKEALKNIEPTFIFDAFLELRLNMNAKSKLQEPTTILVNMIRHATGKSYATPFIRTAIVQYIEDMYFKVDGSDLKNWLRSLSYEEIVDCATEIIRYKTTEKTKDDFLNDCLSDTDEHKAASIKDIENAFGKELIYRLVNGTIRDRISFRG